MNAVKKATNSAVFCLYSPTDTDLLNALLALPNAQKMMFGLINEIPQKDPSTAKHPNQVMVTIYNRTRKGKTFDVVGHDQFGKNNTPNGFWWETSSLGGQSKFPVYIHHKFVVIDGETDHPVIYSGSANLSKNSTNHNDGNLPEITDCPRLAQIYLPNSCASLSTIAPDRPSMSAARVHRTHSNSPLTRAGRRTGTLRARRATAA